MKRGKEKAPQASSSSNFKQKWYGKILFSSIAIIFVGCLSAFMSSNIMANSNEDLKRILHPLLIERRIGTPGHTIAKTYIQSFLKSNNWTVYEHTFVSETPLGSLRFTNLIASFPCFRSPKSNVYLACHYDSKIMPFRFIGATDSAVPCAMLLSLAKYTNEIVREKKCFKNAEIGVKLIFFDGEEAFHDWTDADSLYGARKLAKDMAEGIEEVGSLRQMHSLILLDLIGHRDVVFKNCGLERLGLYADLLNTERRVLSEKSSTHNKRHFTTNFQYGMIGDDHIPFVRLGVPVLHLISVPFPDFWHKESDNENIVDYETTEHILTVIKRFIYDRFLHSTLNRN